ncbi:NADH-cytochrome b5 reductase-like [Adelges cooleyi]|uniref:NADH-cytochrome b5 reductase-like n=1 Tax=Adelges cooleyi TaxID=133065 RepID=UPI00217FD2AD|nr:NADH-cytochrome b5 reductase-like [Adelges cooleyi]
MCDPPPERPSESDCCGSGCVPCVLDVYDAEYARWNIRQTKKSDELRRDLLSVTKYKAFKIAAFEQLSNDTRLYTFIAYPTANGRLPIAFTQHIHIQVDKITRPYTPIALEDNCSFKVIIKAYLNGQFTRKLFSKVVDDIVHVRGPSGGVQFTGYDRIIMFCGGSGIAAFIGLIRTIVENEKCDTLLDLHYSSKTPNDILMRKTLSDLASYWNCKISLYLTRHTNWAERSKTFWYNETVVEGRITKTVISELVIKHQNSLSLWLVCGKDNFNQYCMNYLESYGVNKEFIKLFDNTTNN